MRGRCGRLSSTTSRRRAAWLATALLLVPLGLALPQHADAEPEPTGGSQYGYALAHELMSPYCPGRTLSACPSEQAAELRQWILLQEAAGATREEVIATLEARFGEQIRSAPEARGWGLAAWALPGAVLVVGALLVVVVLRRMVARGQSASPAARPAPAAATHGSPTASGDDAELERLVDAELAAGER